jgi:hypothetical protein
MLDTVYNIGDYFWFGLVFIKKITKLKLVFFKKIKPVQTDRFRFGFLRQNRFKPVWLGFFGLVRFFAGLARFFRFGFGSVRFFQF